MKPTLVTHLLFALGFALLAAVNGLVLSRVEENRKGEPDALLWLTERELPMIDRLEMENTGLALRLVWRCLGSGDTEISDRRPSWLTADKLLRLGFRQAVGGASARAQGKRPAVAREVFLVLEFNGPAYLDAMRRAERALEKEEDAIRANPGDKSLQASRQVLKKRMRAEEQTQSRLFAIDAGTDPRQLRMLYPDPARFIITRGVVRLLVHTENNRERAVAGSIDSIGIDSIHVPLEYRRTIDDIVQQSKPPQNETKTPRYGVQLTYGSRLEPWIAAVRPYGE
jgi:hypothetical protein